MKENISKNNLVILGGGYSVADGLALDLWQKIKDQEIWSLNFVFYFMPYLPSRELWVDTHFFKAHLSQLETLFKQGVKMYCKQHEWYGSFKTTEINRFDTTRSLREAEEQPQNLFIGTKGLVGIFALSLAIREGYKNIYLLGYDFGAPTFENRQTHWYQSEALERKIESNGFGNNEAYLQRNNVPDPSIVDFDYFLRFDAKIYNVSMISHISSFERITYQKFFELISEKNE